MKKKTASYINGYPRPQMVRNSWQSLCGEWSFLFDDARRGEQERWYEHFPGKMKIRVPFSYETKASGIGEEKEHFCVWYARELQLGEQKLGSKRVLLHFEGCDYFTTVWINGRKVGEHEGGYTRFSFDITNYLEESNVIVVRAEDSFDEQQIRGKQRWRNESFRCWYVQTTGIWKDVWFELVNECHVSELRLTPELKKRSLKIDFDVSEMGEVKGLYAKAEISYDGRMINTVQFPVGKYHTTVEIDVTEISEGTELNGIHCWSPENPELYDLEITLYCEGEECDVIRSYFGMREIITYQGNILLNEEPIYQRLVLDQGYYDESGLTPLNEEAIIKDIRRTKELGFNGARKHQKIEDERYYYWCDVLGLLVWCETPSAYRFGSRMINNYMREVNEIVNQFYNHPSIIVWTIFNESWGVNEIRTNSCQQALTKAVYYMVKSLDGERLVVGNDGWEHTVSDIITLHDYEEDAGKMEKRYGENLEDILEGKMYHNLIKSAFAEGYHYSGQPIMISEYGGIAFQNEQIGWGYGNKAKSMEEFVSRYKGITNTIKKFSGICGYCYTQLTDVQQEINGLMDEKRNFKADPQIIKAINQERVGIRMKEECEVVE